MYSPSEQNERDAISVIFKDTTENKNDELNKHPIPRHFPVKEQQTFATEHKKSSFRQQPCSKSFVCIFWSSRGIYHYMIKTSPVFWKC